MAQNPYIRITRKIPSRTIPHEVLQALVGCEVPEVIDADRANEEFRTFDGRKTSDPPDMMVVVRADDLEAWLYENAGELVGDEFKRQIDNLTDEGKVKLPALVGIDGEYCERFSR